MIIAKQTYTPNAAGGPGTVRVDHFRNWDGESAVSTEPTLNEEAAGTFPAVIEALRALLTGKNRSPVSQWGHIFCLLRPLTPSSKPTESPLRDLAVTILDPTVGDRCVPPPLRSCMSHVNNGELKTRDTAAETSTIPSGARSRCSLKEPTGRCLLGCTNAPFFPVVRFQRSGGPNIACLDLWPDQQSILEPCGLVLIHEHPEDSTRWQGATGGEGLYGKEASDREQAVLDAVEASLQMGTSVAHWSDELSYGPAWAGPSRTLAWHGYIMPIYLL